MSVEEMVRRRDLAIRRYAWSFVWGHDAAARFFSEAADRWTSKILTEMVRPVLTATDAR